MERRQEKKIKGQDFFYILTLFLGSTTILWLRKSFLIQNEMSASLRQDVSRFGVYIYIYIYIQI